MGDDFARFGFIAQEGDVFGRGADEFDADGLADFGEVGVLGEEPIAGMDGVCPGDLGRAQDVGNISVAESGVRRPDADLLVGCAHMKARGIGLGIDRDGLNAEFLTGTNYAERDLTAIGYQHFLEHASTPMWIEGRRLRA
jgi:hypothetical protein